MNLNIDPEWLRRKAEQEDGKCVSVGGLSREGGIMTGKLTLWVIFDRPADYPEHFVVRRQDVLPDHSIVVGKQVTLAKSLAEARAAVPDGLHNLGRQPGDVPSVVEVWI